MIYPIRNIVAGIATLDGPDPLLAPALDVAVRTGAVLHLVHAFQLPDLVLVRDGYAQMGLIDPRALEDHANALQARLQAQVRAVTVSDRVRCEVFAGPSAPMILEAAVREKADLIIVGATRHGTVARAILGTTAQRVLREAPAPVLVLGGSLAEHLQRALFTTDLSEFSAGIHEAGLDVVESLFSGDEPELRSLHVVREGGGVPFPLEHSHLDKVAREGLSTFLGQRRLRARPVEAVLRYGDPAREIAAEATDWKADLLVVGTHGRKAPERWFLGSVAEASIRGAVGSVLVIPARIEEQRTLPVALSDAHPATRPSA